VKLLAIAAAYGCLDLIASNELKRIRALPVSLRIWSNYFNILQSETIFEVGDFSDVDFTVSTRFHFNERCLDAGQDC
jgi:hypothetical protein